MKKVLVCGSLAYDYIMNFDDKFRNHILPDKIHILNVCFSADNLSKEFGGTAGNIAYNLKLLGLEPVIFAAAGKDFEEYKSWFKFNKIKTDYIKQLKNEFTASAHIITDQDDNQITSFHGGAMLHNHRSLRSVVRKEKIGLAICAPDCLKGMKFHVRELQSLKIPYVFDPGQSIVGFSGNELKSMAKGAKVLIFNDYEYHVFKQKTKWKQEQILKVCEYLIITLGGKGSKIYCGGRLHRISCARPRSISDPTGAGDAYRAGLIYGLLNNFVPDKMGKIGACVSVYTVEKYGTQTHKFDLKNLKNKYYKNFKEKL